MREQIKSMRVQIAGWIAFLFAIWICVDHLMYMKAHNTTGAPVVLGFITAFLSFAAAAFGISAHERKIDLKIG
jgi:uncharacterized membrane protein